MCTALANVTSGSSYQTIRALLDTGASISLITNHVVQALQMKTIPYKLNITCMGGGMVSESYVDARLTVAHGSPEEDDDFIVARCQMPHCGLHSTHNACPQHPRHQATSLCPRQASTGRPWIWRTHQNRCLTGNRRSDQVLQR